MLKILRNTTTLSTKTFLVLILALTGCTQYGYKLIYLRDIQEVTVKNVHCPLVSHTIGVKDVEILGYGEPCFVKVIFKPLPQIQTNLP